MKIDSRLIRLHPDDNVLIVTSTLPAGTELLVGERRVCLGEALPLGFKIAAEAIPASGKIIKYTVPVGSALVDIAPGETVHLHNMKSDYIPTWTREQGSGH
ncbi:MAG: hypothetical protein RL095_3235 [Verrucomicrobiota bacterium]|jgi:hypothetical protein